MKEIKEALSKLTNRPWIAKKGAGWFVQLGEAIAIVEQPAVVGMKIEEDTAKFIAKSPEYVSSLLSKVEEMQKTLEWYADEKNYELFDANVTEYSYETTSAIWEDEGERARQALKGDPYERLTRNS